MEGLVIGVANGPLFGGVYEGRRVFVTGHTGFKGSWLTFWLLSLGAHVTGYSLEPPTAPSLFDELGMVDMIDHHIGDVRDLEHLREVMTTSRPEIVLHLAAQALVLLSYDEPAETFEANVMGTVNLLEAIRATPTVRAVVNVTSDKCYENREWEFAYRENDPIGGFDPYSASKGCSELVSAAYRRSYFGPESAVAFATARAGNVIGGGDWAADRIVPDCIRALSAGEAIAVRNPDAVRPWQHVLEPTSGYLLLASRLFSEGHGFEGPWNFGPNPTGNLTVAEIVDGIVATWGSGSWQGPPTGSDKPHEAHFLKLDCSKAADLLSWHPVWDAETAIAEAAGWYRDFYAGVDAEQLVRVCLERYVAGAFEADDEWAAVRG